MQKVCFSSLQTASWVTAIFKFKLKDFNPGKQVSSYTETTETTWRLTSQFFSSESCEVLYAHGSL